MKRRRVQDALREAGAQDAPPPRPEFVRDVEARFGTTRVVTAPTARHRAPWALVGVATAAAVLAGALLLASSDHDEQGVSTLPTLETTTTTATSTTTTTHEVVATTSTSVAENTTTTAVHATTTTTEVPATTTTTAVPTQDLGLHCATRPDTLAVICEWSASTDHTFDHFRLWKHTGDGPDQELYSGTARRFEDHELSGARMYYDVTALAADGQVLGHSETFVTCC